MLARRIVDCQGDDFPGGRNLEEYLRKSGLEVADDQFWRLVDYVGRQEDHQDYQEDGKLDGHSRTAGSSAPASWEAEERVD